MGEAQKKKSTDYKNRFNAANYDSLRIVVPKGRKADIEAFARDRGESINGMVNRLIQNEMGLADNDWRIESNMSTISQLRRILNNHGYSLRKKHKGEDSWWVVEGIKKAGDAIGDGSIVAGNENGPDAPGLTTEDVSDFINRMGWNLS